MKGIQVFNKYISYGGEESSVDRIYGHLGETMSMSRCFFDSKDWQSEGKPSSLGQLKKMFHNSKSYQLLTAEIERENPDFIMYHNTIPVASPSVYRAAFDKGIPTIQYIHNFRPFSVGGSLWVNGKECLSGLNHNHLPEIWNGTWQNSKLKSFIAGMVLYSMQWTKVNQRISHWIAISDCIRDAFIKAGVPADKITTIRHSWDARKEEPSKVDEGYYLLFSRLIPEKGITELLDGWALLYQELGLATPKLIIAGQGDLEHVVKQASQKTPSIQYIGYTSGREKSDLLENCRALLAPSVWQEPLGLAPFEAYDYAKPIIASRNGGLNETVFHKKTGYKLDAVTPEKIKEAVIFMESVGEKSRQEMGLKGREWLLSEGSPEAWKEKFNAVIDKLPRDTKRSF